MSVATSPVLVRAHEQWPTLHRDIVSDTWRLRKLAYARVARAPDAEEQERVPGAFGVLPVELVDVICAKLLRIGFEHFFSFVCTCRAAYHVASKRTTIEAMCMKNLFNRTSLAHRVAMMDKAEQYPFTELAKTMIRSRVEQEVLQECIEGSVLHCANPTSECCRTQRAELNACWGQHPTIAERFPKGTLGAEALRGRRACNVSVAASSASHLLCATPDGAVLASDNRVWTVTSKPATEFTPGYELAATPLMEYSRIGANMAAAEGNRIAVCQYSHETRDETFYDVKIFDDGRLVDEVEVNDTRRRGELAGSSSVEKMWIHKGEVWFAFMHENQSHNFAWMRLLAVQPDLHGNRSAHCRHSYDITHSFGRIDCISVAADSGDVVLLEELSREVRIWCFDMKTRKFGLVSPHPKYGHPSPHTPVGVGMLHQIRLSPDGLTMVVFDRTNNSWGAHRSTRSGPILLYTRSGVGAGDRQGWRLIWTGGDSPHRPVATVIRSSPMIEALFTPCGRRFYALFLATPDSPGGMLRLDTTFTSEVNDTFSNVPPYRLPTKMVWSKDGLFVRTSTVPTGVLRLGLVE